MAAYSPAKHAKLLHACCLPGHQQDLFNQQSYEDRCSGTVQLLIDMELMAATDYFVGSYNSRWPRVVNYLRYILRGKDRLSTVDASYYATKLDLLSKIKSIFEKTEEADPDDE